MDEYKGLDFLNERLQKLEREFLENLLLILAHLPCDEGCISIYRKNIGLESWWNPRAWIIVEDNWLPFLPLHMKALSFYWVVEGEKAMDLTRFRFEIKVVKLINNFYYLDTIYHYSLPFEYSMRGCQSNFQTIKDL